MKKSVYDSVTNEKRVNLINMVNKGEKLNKSAALLNINYSTAKTILRIFRNEKRIFKKVPVKSVKKKVFHIERANSSTHISEEKVECHKEECKTQFKMPKFAFKRLVQGNSEVPSHLVEIYHYLFMRDLILSEISTNQNKLNILQAILMSSNHN